MTEAPEIPELALPPGIPSVIPFARAQDMCTALGLPINDLVGFSLHANSIEAEFYASDEKGNRFLRGNDGHVATHKVTIKIDRDDRWLFQRRPNVYDDGPNPREAVDTTKED